MQWSIFPAAVPDQLSGLWITRLVHQCAALPFVFQVEAVVHEVCNVLPYLRCHAEADWAAVQALLDTVDDEADDEETMCAVADLVYFVSDCYRSVEKAMMQVIGGAQVEWQSLCLTGSIEANSLTVGGVQHRLEGDCFLILAQHTPHAVAALLTVMCRVQSVITPFCRAMSTLNRGFQFNVPVYQCTLTPRHNAQCLMVRMKHLRSTTPAAFDSGLAYLRNMDAAILSTRSGRAAAKEYFESKFPLLDFELTLRLIAARKEPGAVALSTRYTPQPIVARKQYEVAQRELTAAFCIS